MAQISFQCLDDNDIERILETTKTRNTRIKMRELADILNTKNKTTIANKIDINTLRNMMIDKGICKIYGSHTNLINKQYFIDTFKAKEETIENAEDIMLLTVEEAINMNSAEILKLTLEEAEIVLKIRKMMRKYILY